MRGFPARLASNRASLAVEHHAHVVRLHEVHHQGILTLGIVVPWTLQVAPLGFGNPLIDCAIVRKRLFLLNAFIANGAIPHAD